jgi:iron(III) transport system substrate-binding protein
MKKLILVLLILSFVFGLSAQAFSKELVIYTARKEHLVKPVFDKYTKETGVKIKYITGKAPVLLQRLISEGKNSPADMLITVDAGNLWNAAQNGVLSKVESTSLESNIPEEYRDSSGYWFGLSLRARTIVYNSDRVNPKELSGYSDLADSKWKNRLLLRTSKKVYNQSLVAMMIAENGEKETLETVKGWVSNLAAPPFSSDTKVLKAVAAGQGDVTIVNTYYLGRLLKKSPNLPLKIFWPDQDKNGVHVNVSGAGVTKYSKNKKEAVKFLEWLSSENAQNLFADINMEYPVNKNIKPHSFVKAWGEFKASKMKLENAGAMQKEAVKLMDKAGYK